MTLPIHSPLRCFYAISFILLTTPALTYGACPTTATTFEFNAPPGNTTTDTSGLLIGNVPNGTTGFQGNDGYLHLNGVGDGQAHATESYFDLPNTEACLEETRNFTYEIRFKPAEVDLDSEHLNPGNIAISTVQTLFQRRFSYHFKLRRADFMRENLPPPGQAPLWFAYRSVDNSPGGRKTHEVYGDVRKCPIVEDHWYQVKVVFNADRKGGTPVDIFADDQGTDGMGTSENWAGYINCSQVRVQVNEWRGAEGDEVEPVLGKTSYPLSIGTDVAKVQTMLSDPVTDEDSLYDWLSYKPTSDYSGVDVPAFFNAEAGNGVVNLNWSAVPGATAYNLYYCHSRPKRMQYNGK